MKIRPVGAELFRADRRTDMTKLIVAFRNFANALKIAYQLGRQRKTNNKLDTKDDDLLVS